MGWGNAHGIPAVLRRLVLVEIVMKTADIILKNVNVITMDAGNPSAEAVAISGDKILLVGSNAEAATAIGAGTRIIDGGGKTVIPGFIDAHLHLFSLMKKLLSVDLGPAVVSSIEDIKQAIHRQAESTPPGKWISGTDYNEFYLAEKRFPTRWDIDEVAPNHPVILSHRSLHACVLNSLALELAGIGMETPEPPGATIERDPATGEPNGVLYEMLGDIRGRVVPALCEAELDEATGLVNTLFLTNGITSFHEATYRNDPGRWKTVCKLKEAGRLHSRVSMMAGTDFWQQFQESGLVSGSGDNRVRLGAVKVMVTQTAGKLHPPPEELKRLALDIHRAGFQLAYHAEEEDVIGAVIDTLEYIDSIQPVAGRRHRIEHCAEGTPRLLKRLPRLGVVIVNQPPFIFYSGERYLATVASDVLPWMYRIKSPLESGLVVAGSSDTPVVPLNPLAGIYAAVTRKTASGQDFFPEEAVSPLQALSMYTVNAAYASLEEDIKGSIVPGKLADMVVLSDDPTRVPPEQIKDIKVEMTILGGELIWEG
jgi:predicted amidohydrolase YtcJ